MPIKRLLKWNFKVLITFFFLAVSSELPYFVEGPGWSRRRAAAPQSGEKPVSIPLVMLCLKLHPSAFWSTNVGHVWLSRPTAVLSEKGRLSVFCECGHASALWSEPKNYLTFVTQRDILLLLFTPSLYLICKHNTGRSRFCLSTENTRILSTARLLGGPAAEESNFNEIDQQRADTDVDLTWWRLICHLNIFFFFFYTIPCGSSLRQSWIWVCSWGEWDVIDGAICFPSSSAATHEQPRTRRAVSAIERETEGARMGFSCHSQPWVSLVFQT